MNSAESHQSSDKSQLPEQAQPHMRDTAVGRRSGMGVVVMAVWRGWWLFGLAVIVASLFSVAEYARRTPLYQSEQAYFVLVSPAGASTTYDLYQARVWEETIGHALAEGRLTTVAGGFASLIDAELAAERGVGAPLHLSPAQLQQSLVWSNSGNVVVLTASWTTPQGASALVGAVTAALERGDLTHVTIWRGALPPQMVARIIPSPAGATPPALDQSRQAAAEQLLLARMAVGVAAGMLLLLIWEWVRHLARWRTHIGESTPAAGGSRDAQDVNPSTGASAPAAPVDRGVPPSPFSAERR